MSNHETHSDLTTPPFGAFSPPRWFRPVRALALNPRTPNFLRTQLERSLAFLVKNLLKIHDTEYHGLRWRLYPRESWGDRAITLKNAHPIDDEIEFIKKFESEEMVLIDIGANVGIYTLLSAKYLPPNATIISVEPHPNTAEKLKTNIGLNRALLEKMVTDLRIEEVALGDQNATLRLFQPNNRDIGSNSLHAEFSDAPYIEVKVVPLLTLVLEHKLSKIDILKIDVEGFEDKVLLPFFRDADRSVWPRAILMEVLLRKKWEVDVVSHLLSIGYRVVSEDGNDIRLEL